MNEISRIKTPIGILEVRTNKKGVYQVHLTPDMEAWEQETPPGKRSIVMNQVLKELQEYFAGNRRCFTVPLDLDTPPFYKKALLEVSKVPFGKTSSYQEIARRAGNVKAARAAGTANANNPIAIIIPCHRIVSSDGTLGGYGGGLDKKMILLEHEGVNITL